MIRLLIASLLVCIVSLGNLLNAEEKSAAELQRGIALSPRAFRAAAEKVQASIVRIETFGGFDSAAKGRNSFVPGEGPTTGVVYSADGLIVTSTFNFIKKPPVITVILPDGERKVAQLLGRDDTRKICLLKVEPSKPLSVPEFLSRDALQVGQWGVAIGVGFGDKETALTAGIISATHRIGAKAVQTDANLSPANYGGPLIDLSGRVIGICVPLSPESSETGAGAEWYDSGIGFAVPLTGIDSIISSLKAGKTLTAPFLGVQTKFNDNHAPGAVIADLVAEQPAAKAGLAKGDLIQAVGGTEVLDPTHLVSLIRRSVAGDSVVLKIKRGAEEKQFTVELGTVPPPQKPDPNKKPEPGKPPQPQPPPMKPQPKTAV